MNRLEFIENKDGRDKAIEFANRAIKAYRKYLLNLSFHPMNRRYIIEDYLRCKRFISNTNRAIKSLDTLVSDYKYSNTFIGSKLEAELDKRLDSAIEDWFRWK